MFEWLKRIQAGVAGGEEILHSFEQMLEDGRHVFDLAVNALLAGTDPVAVREDIWATDKRINRTERLIRRRIVVHLATSEGASASIDLAMMSVVKDAERIGDYAKNLFDLAVLGRGFREEDRQELLAHRETVSRMLAKARNIHSTGDEDDARAFIAAADKLSREFDEKVNEAVLREDPDGTAANTALTYRYLKRVVRHVTNIITSVVVPVDRLDYWDEDEAGRAEEPPAGA